jgi:hypothetical protein
MSPSLDRKDRIPSPSGSGNVVDHHEPHVTDDHTNGATTKTVMNKDAHVIKVR